MDLRVAPAELLLAQPRGFCAGVVRAIDVVEQALALFGAPVYVFHEIVHNGHVVQALQCRGAVFVERIDQIPHQAVTIFSAHGVSRAVVAQARSRNLRVIDATCPLVAKVQLQARRYAQAGRTVLVIGHAGHDEVVGTLGHIDGPAHVLPNAEAARALDLPATTPLAYVTQTTLSVDDTRSIIQVLVARFPDIRGPALADICYATQNRQTAVRVMAQRVDRLLVVGARNSSNACRLREVGEQQGVPAWLVEDASQIDPNWLLGARCIGVTAGASTPEALVQGVCERLRLLGARSVRQMPGKPETVRFRLPSDLIDARAHLDAPGLPA
jgi:4-hydroxy-3-methylbut-2-en-1-yl diphosphate reductase